MSDHVHAIGAANGRLWYPRNQGEDRQIRVSLYDVRAADDLVIGYDFDRDGWTIARDSNPDREVAFVRAWADLEQTARPLSAVEMGNPIYDEDPLSPGDAHPIGES